MPGALHRPFDAVAHSRRELLSPAADQDSDAAAVHLVDLALHRLVKQAHERAHLGARAGPVLGRERVNRQRVDAEVLACLEDALDGTDSRAVAEARGATLTAGPSARAP